MSKEKEENKTVSQALLESYRTALYKVKDFYDSLSKHDFSKSDMGTNIEIMESVLKTGEKLGKNIETLAILEAKVEKEQLEKTSRRGGTKTSLFEG